MSLQKYEYIPSILGKGELHTEQWEINLYKQETFQA